MAPQHYFIVVGEVENGEVKFRVNSELANIRFSGKPIWDENGWVSVANSLEHVQAMDSKIHSLLFDKLS